MDLEAVWQEQAAQAEARARLVPSALLPTKYPEVAGHGFELIPAWKGVDQLPERISESAHISRGDVFELAAQARAGEGMTWTQVLVAAYAWGYAGTGIGPARGTKILNANGPRVEPTLVRCVELLDAAVPLAAYFLLRNPGDASGVGRLKGLGPAFFTKFLYFARPANAEVQPLILDQLLARQVQQLCSDDTLLTGWRWTTPQYGFYLAFMHELARRPETGQRYARPGGPTPDEMERALFGVALERRAAARRGEARR